MADLLKLLLRVAEKAANVARVCRKEAPLFQLLVQEKTGVDKNKKFVQDFKTLADVVIQEMIRHDVGAQFPEMIDHIHGEESNKFENGLGESVIVTVCGTEKETAALLATVLDGDQTAATLLAHAIHQDAKLTLTDTGTDDLHIPLSPSDLGIWIDPIDATSQYIEGREEAAAEGRLCPSGLQCALVLIGVYLRATGEPVMGVINQPFNHKDPTGWKGKHFWGVSCGNIKACSVLRPKDRPAETTAAGGPGLSVVMSSSEKQTVKEALAPLCGPDRLMYASGAGYKILCVILGLADVYVLSEGSTFKWDSCGPHALLRALGGGMVDLKECLHSSGSSHCQGGHQDQGELTYHQPHTESTGADHWANQGGLVAYLNCQILHRVIGELKGKF
ncbi:Inositol polyphosphate 1-phosphatase [Salmo salar]|uniref:Inositol polyphosphate 1-phosphatase n=1 Tax=Salmo salar TaxID=8030 RepID=C0H8H4_SALSA|nr:Inositol polyphosphate 1-phosphatase [Salmo salar]ACN10343.1 Inositol polyphosphate 1-phosphatase [Salmo salar]ACN12703.1 Inositol polyphosphate 1-phosphatase [Salmo salar]|eukprot:NP_001158760.1 Inositol polyphosphate 1-phosphatase [Salmo salar]